MKGIDHLVLAGRDLEAMRARYRALGFTLTPHGRHPFGTANSLVQFESWCFLELLAVAAPAEIPEAAPGLFSFAAFNRDFLARREGFSMLVLDSHDAEADIAAFRAAGLATYGKAAFSRKAKQPDGSEPMVGFSLAFASTPLAPDAGFFCCQQHAPQYFWKPDYQRHANTALGVSAVMMTADEPQSMRPFLESFSGCAAGETEGGLSIATARGAILVLTPQAYFATYRMTPPSGAGPRFAGYSLHVHDLAAAQRCLSEAGVPVVGRRGRLVVPPEFTFGAALAFEAARSALTA